MGQGTPVALVFIIIFIIFSLTGSQE
uniref:Uncharacterized protein n=1 Tax=Rhizophora mucronata TaxID=61149 RepID=A0A2P2PAQ5_RHIMU